MNVPPSQPDHDRGTPQGGYPSPPQTHAYGPPGGPTDAGHPSAGHPGAPGSAGPEPVERLYPLAGWRSRVFARGIDLVLVVLPALLLALVLSLAWVGIQEVFGGSTSGMDERYPMFLSVTFFLLYTGYETFALSRWQQTVGKARMGLKVAPLAGTGRLGPVPLPALAVRAALFAFPFLLLFLLFSDFGWFWWLLVVVMTVFTGGMAAWNRPNQQGLHDKIAGTVVLDVA